MKRSKLSFLVVGAAMVAVTGLSSPNIGSAEVEGDVNATIGLGADDGLDEEVDDYAPLPEYDFAAPPDVVPIPGSYAYYVPGIDVDILFYNGFWYRPYRGYWYKSRFYNGPWGYIGHRHVPRYLMDLPPRWRDIPPIYDRIPYDRFNRDWRRWERERFWERNDKWREWRDRRNREGRLWERDWRDRFDRDRRDWRRDRDRIRDGRGDRDGGRIRDGRGDRDGTRDGGR
ncbi:MAG: hypothetical protein WC291_07400, partial [Thermodesulfovibrionales bacterium]